jgi:hypothetical protein
MGSSQFMPESGMSIAVSSTNTALAGILYGSMFLTNTTTSGSATVLTAPVRSRIVQCASLSIAPCLTASELRAAANVAGDPSRNYFYTPELQLLSLYRGSRRHAPRRRRLFVVRLE